MQELEADAKKAGITVMNEIGLDPVSIYNQKGGVEYPWLMSMSV